MRVLSVTLRVLTHDLMYRRLACEGTASSFTRPLPFLVISSAIPGRHRAVQGWYREQYRAPPPLSLSGEDTQ